MLLTKKIANTLSMRILIVLVFAAGFSAASRLAFDAFHFHQNKQLMSELSQQTLHRAELLVDYAVITIGDLAAAGLGRCDPDSLMEIRKSIYLRGAIKDVQVLGGTDRLRCAGLPQARSLGVIAAFDYDKGYSGRNSSIRLYDMGMDGSGLLGVGWRFAKDETFLAVLNVDSLMFEVFPAALRESSRAVLLLGGRDAFARHAMASATISPTDVVAFSHVSSRYPLEAKFMLSAATLKAWNRGAEPYVIAGGASLGLVLGLLLASLLARPADPTREMRAGLRRGEFVPYMQPVFAIADGRITGCEVLTRWVKPDGEVIPPYRFIPIAEESGLIVPITRDVVRAALVALASHLKSNPTFKVAFNIVPSDLVSEEFATDISDIAEEFGVALNQIVLELTERQQFSDPIRAVRSIKALQALGFKVALDDTGTGHNGLSYVQELGADIIKIDKHFVDIVGMNRAATTIVKMLVRLAAELGMTTVAEGIETQEQLDALRACEVDEGQGYLVSRPVPIDEFMDLIKKEKRPTVEAVAA